MLVLRRPLGGKPARGSAGLWCPGGGGARGCSKGLCCRGGAPHSSSNTVILHGLQQGAAVGLQATGLLVNGA